MEWAYYDWDQGHHVNSIMSSEKRTFPDGFLWGASTAAYQVEGGIENADWSKAGHEGKVPVAGRACDFYNRYESDFDIAVGIGMNAQRFSIEWARIEPEEGKFDEKEIEHYRAVFAALKKRNLKSIGNLWHFTLPLWFAERGGFLHKDAPAVFARYCAYVIEKLGAETDLWITINEPLVYAGASYMGGTWPPFHKNPLTFLRVFSALINSHKAAYEAMKKKRSAIQIGIAKNNIDFISNWNPLNKLLCVFVDWFWNHRFLGAMSEHQDFIGLNHYRQHTFGATKEEKAKTVRSDMGWGLHSESLYNCLIGLKPYELPVYVSENGIADAADTRRAQFLRDAALAAYRAIQDGVQLKGYFYWSLLDNYEWAFGFEKRFGLIEINYDTLERKVRPSAIVYSELCRTNALPDGT